MQNFPNSPVPLHPGFSRGGSVGVSSPYQSHASDLQISPRSSEDFAAMQQAHSNLQSQGQHLHLRSQQHLLHGPPVHAYGSRMGSGEITQGNALSASSYRKESMDYYFSVSGRERSRRGYGAGFSYTNMDGHVPNQYQHLSGSGSSSGMISPYTMDYSSNTASGVGATSSSSSSNSTSSSGGAGSFSPSQQYALTHNTPVQSGTPIQQRQHGQKYPSHQGLHHHRAYSLSGNRVPSKFGHYSSINTSSGSTVMYNSPPQRYDVSSSGNSTDAKINNSPTRTNPSASGSNSCENVGQSYSSSSHTPYSPQSQSLHKHAPHSQRTTQSTVAGYEASQKMQPGALVHTKMIHSSIPSSPALPPPPAQDIAKSPMHSQNQQTRIHQNFSPISNPSPAPSAVQSPGCSSSSSPLMSSSEGNGAAAHVQVSSLPSNSNAQSSQSHGRLLQALPQLSPTPSSNSSISSCGSSLGAKTVGFSHSTGYPKATLGQRGSSGEAGPLYHPDKLLQDPGLNSLNALTSQVENLPNTVQHMLLTDTVLSQKKCREQGYQSVPAKQNKCAIEESSETKGDQRNRIRQSSGASNESEPSSDLLSQSHLHLECSQHGLDLQVNASIISSASKQPAASSATVFSQTKTAENLSSSPAQLSVNPSKEPRTKPSSTQFPHQKCVPEKDLGYNGMKEQKIIKHEESDVETGDPPCHRAKSENSFQNTKDVQSVSPIQNESDTDAQQCEDGSKHINISEQHNVGGVGVIVSARSEMNIESSKPTAAKSSGCSVSHYLKKHGCPEEQHDVSRLRETRNQNGDREICKQTYTSPYDMSPKEEGGQGIASNNSHSILNKYNNSEVQYNICKSTKNKGKSGAGSEIGPDRYPSHYQLQSNYGSFARKDIGVLAGEGGRVVVSRGLDGSSQFQPSFPSLLQEVLQGHHLDRRYGLPDQTSSVRNRSQDHHYQTRLPYSMIENFSSHGMAGTNVLFNQMASGKQTNFFQNQGPDKELALGPSHPAWDSEAQRPNLTHEIPLEKVKTSLTPSHVQQSTDLPTVAPQKHIILADYSLQNRKASRYGTSSSAVEQLLLQETEPLACAAGPIGQTLSSGRRSVICDVSPSRRTTPERDRATSGLSVIQQSFSSLNDQDCSKEEIKVKKEQSIEDISKIHLAGHNADEFCSTPDIKDPHKYLKVPVDAESDSERINCVKGTSEPASNRTHFSQISSNPRHQSYIQAVETFRPYGFSDTMDGPKMVSHSTSHHSFQTAASYSKTTPSPNKSQSFSQSVPPQKRPDWTSDKYRVKDTDQDVSQRQAEQKTQSLSDDLPSQLHLSQQHSYPASHFDTKMWNVYPEQDKPPAPVPREHVASPPVINTVSKQREGDKNSLKSAEEPAKSLHSLALEGGVTPAGHTSKATQGMQQGWRPTKSGASAETNPLIMRRRVRSFISPIPAKRQHHDCSVQRSASSYINNNSSEIIDTQPKIASPTTQQSTANSPLQCKTKILPPRKGRGLKLEAIVQKITPGVKKTTFNNSHIDSEYSDASLYTSDVPDPEVSMSFSSVAQGDEACLSYLDDSHTLNDLMSYRVGEDAFNCDSLSLKSVAATTTSNGSLRSVPKDFDFGLGPAGSSSSLVGENDKDDFTLLGPLPPPPPLPCPVQGSPPPSSSALSDIQQFANTYQQLETRRGEQSAANLLRQKLQETGFDEYAAGDYYSHSPGNHHLSRGHHNQMASLKLANSEFKASENLVPKGYFPSGKKKGRPVGSVNKQKRAQASISNALSSIPAATLASPSTAPQCVPDPSIPGDVPETPPDQEACPLMEAPAQMQMLKLGEDNEERLPEVDVKPHKPKQKKGKEGNEGVDSGGGQRRRRRGMSSKEEQDTQACSRGNMSLCGIVSDIRYNVFSPYIHVEKKIAEIGAVCTVVNGEEEKSKSGSKVSHLGVDASLSTSLSFQAVRRERENERCKESRVSEQVESDLQPRKTLPSSGFVLPGPVTAETAHTGRLLCCLCQKWANNKHLGDLYGPFYPAEYAAKLPKNQPQIRQSLSYHGTAATGLNTVVSKDSTSQDTRLQDPQNVNFLTNSDCTASHATNPISPATTFGSTPPGVAEEITFQNTKTSSFNSRVATHTDDRQADHPTSGLGSLKVQEPESLVALKQLPLEDTQQWPQHRKLTSHPRFKRRHKSSEDLPGRIPINNKASLPFQPPPPSLDSMGPMAQLAQLPLVPLDPQELWVHEGCIIWTSGIYLVNGRLYGLQEALDGARDASCSHCDMLGSTLGCYSKGCTHRYHYLCALEADCSLDEDNFSLRCPKHKSNRISKPGAAYLEQSERG